MDKASSFYRTRAVTARGGSLQYPQQSMAFDFGLFVLDVERRQLLSGGGEVHLSPKAFELLHALVERRPKVVAKAELHDRLWPNTFVSESSLAGLVKELRSALQDDSRAPRYIRTVHGYGYAFCSDVEDAAGPVPVARLRWSDGEALLYQGRNVIGRDPRLPARVDDHTVSRQHAAIIIAGEIATVIDLESKNGTFLGGIAVKSCAVPLREGDELTLGSVVTRFHVLTDTSTATLHRLA